MDPKRAKGEWGIQLLVFLFTIGALATARKACWNAVVEGDTGVGAVCSRSVAEARRRGTLVSELQAIPDVLDLNGETICFGEAWVEGRSLPTHSLVWLPAEKR